MQKEVNNTMSSTKTYVEPRTLGKYYCTLIWNLLNNRAFAFSLCTIIAMAIGILVVCFKIPKPSGMYLLL
ncbi:unnamed protein product [Adineta ricciae]|uniref:Uncharacterized protein n=1 Tax=Adineta ricciae TaxID=249248 RepID=A0A815U1R1_ADIRI|nr:unnamed protein product [Adineta ricciae]